MKALISFLVPILLSLLIVSCHKDHDLALINENDKVQTRSEDKDQIIVWGDPISNDILREIKGIPVNIYFPAKSAGDKKMFLSCTADRLELASADNGSGKQIWYIKESPATGRFTVEVAAGFEDNKKYISEYPDGPVMRDCVNHFGGYWYLVPSNGYWQFYSPVEQMVISSEGYGRTDLRMVKSTSETDVSPFAQFVIGFTEKYKLSSVDYEVIKGKEYVKGETVYLKSYPLTNQTDYPITRTMQVEESYSFSSTFSETRGVAMSNSISVEHSETVSVPSINLTENDKIQVTKRTEQSFSYTAGQTRSQSLKMTQTVLQNIPAHETVILWIEAKEYRFDTNYIGNFRGMESGRILKLSGNWAGVQYYGLGITVTNGNGKVLGRYDSKGNFIPAKGDEAIDVQQAKKSVMLHE